MTGANSYAYAVGRVKALEARLLDSSNLQRMIDAVDFEDALRFIGDGDYAGLSGTSDFESRVDAVIMDANKTVASFSPDPYFTGMFYSSRDFLWMKAEIKRLMMRRQGLSVHPDCAIRPGWLPEEFLNQAAQGAASLKETVSDQPFTEGRIEREEKRLRSFLSRAAQDSVASYEKSGRDPMEIDLEMDKAYFRYISEMASSRDATWARKLIAARADMTNVLLLLRSVNAGKDAGFISSSFVQGGMISEAEIMESAVQGEPMIRRTLERTPYWKKTSTAYAEWVKTSSIRKFEMAADLLFSGLVKEAKMISEGYEPVLGYLLMKQIECHAIRKILLGKLRRLPHGTIRERLSDGDA